MSNSDATPDRAAVNRENAQHSTGPRTAEGKQSVRFNALRHGIYSQTIVLPTEDRDAYERLGKMLLDTFDPQTEYERDLVQTVQDIDWQIKRLRSIESGMIAIGMEREFAATSPDQDPAVRRQFAASAAWEKNAKLFDQMSRHSGRLTRQRDKTRQELRELQTARRAAAKSAPLKIVPAQSVQPRPALIPAGFVPAEIDAPASSLPAGAPALTESEIQELLKTL